MNDIIFSNSFYFNAFCFDKYKYTDNRSGSPSHYFAYMTSGRCEIVTSDETVKINRGDIFYIPNKVSYRSYWYGEPEIKFISLGFQYLPNFDNKNYPVQVIEKNDTALEIMSELSQVSQLNATYIGKFYTLVGMLLPSMNYISPCRTKEIVDKTEKYLFENPFATAYDLAKNCAISESALYSAFKKSGKLTPNQLKNNILLEKAKELLITTDNSIEYVSDFFNFSSSSYFRKKFKKYFGITPREMRKNYKI